MKFKTYLNEITITKKSREGDEVMFSPVQASKKENKNRMKQLAKSLPIEQTFIFLGLDRPKKVHETIDLGSSKPVSVFLSYNKRVYEIIYSESWFKTMLISHGGKSSTHDKTELKEFITIVLFEKDYTQDEVIDIIAKAKPRLVSFYKTEYYTSAKKAANALHKNYKPKSGTQFELQGDKLSTLIYEKAKQLGLKGNVNNWNPGDVWGFSEKGKNSLSGLSSIGSLAELRDFLDESYDNKDIISVSLKLVKDVNNAKYKVIEPQNRPPIPHDLRVKSIGVPDSYKSAIFYTNDDISLKANMRGSSSTTCMNMEMYDESAKSSLGAVIASEWDMLIAANGNSLLTCKNFKPKTESEITTLLEKSYKIFKLNNKINKDSFEYEDLDFQTKIRYIINASMIDFVMGNGDIIHEAFYLSQKYIKSNPIYVKIG